MGIEDIQLSEELETNAPSIKYRGEEGPGSPQEEQMIMLIKKLMSQGLDMESAAKMAQQMMAEAGQQQMPQQQMPRQMAAFGGIMGLDGRRKYGIGSSLKKFVRKIIPNEVSELAVKAAPFVAPFNAPLAGLMAGVGSFDQTGRIGSSLKAGLGTYAQGKIMSGIGGGGYQGGKTMNPFNPAMYTKNFTSPIGTKSGIGQLFKGGKFNNPFATTPALTGEAVTPGMTGVEASEGAIGKNVMTDALGGEATVGANSNLAKQGFFEAPKKFLGQTVDKVMEYVPTSFSDLTDPKKLLGAAGILTFGTKLLGGGPEETIDTIMSRGDGYDMEDIRTRVTEAFKDPSGKKLEALRIEFPYLGTKESKNLDAMAMGGRAGYGLGNLVRGSSMFQPVSASMSAENAPSFEGGSGMGGMIADLIRKNPQLFKNVSGQNNSSDSPMPSSPMPGIGMGGMFSKFFSNPRMYNQYLREKEDFIDENFNDIDDREEVAMGGRIRRAEGGLMDLGGMELDYRAEGGFVPIGRKEKADDVPARLSVNEFVFTADAVRNAGGGDIDQGAEIMENVMKNLEQGGQMSEESQGMQGARDMFQTSQRLGEVL